MVEIRDVQDRVYDLSLSRDLQAIADMCRRPDKYRFDVDETILLPFRHIRYKAIPDPKDPNTYEVHDEVFDLSDNRDLTEIETMCMKPEKFRFLVDEPLNLPFRHIRFEIIRSKE